MASGFCVASMAGGVVRARPIRNGLWQSLKGVRVAPCSDWIMKTFGNCGFQVGKSVARNTERQELKSSKMSCVFSILRFLFRGRRGSTASRSPRRQILEGLEAGCLGGPPPTPTSPGVNRAPPHPSLGRWGRGGASRWCLSFQRTDGDGRVFTVLKQDDEAHSRCCCCYYYQFLLVFLYVFPPTCNRGLMAFFLLFPWVLQPTSCQ